MATPHRDRPVLVLISGPPGAGKSTLAAQLSERLALPWLSLDLVKASLGLQWADSTVRAERPVVPDAVARRGGASGQEAFRVAYAAAGLLLENGCSLVLEKAWQRGRSELDLRPLLAAARGVQVHVVLPREVALQRGRDRAPRPGLVDTAAVEQALDDGSLQWDAFEPLDLGVPLIEVDTSGAVDLDALERRIWSAVRQR